MGLPPPQLVAVACPERPTTASRGSKRPRDVPASPPPKKERRTTAPLQNGWKFAHNWGVTAEKDAQFLQGTLSYVVRANKTRLADDKFTLPQCARVQTKEGKQEDFVLCAVYRHEKKHLILVRQTEKEVWKLEPISQYPMRQLVAIEKGCDPGGELVGRHVNWYLRSRNYVAGQSFTFSLADAKPQAQYLSMADLPGTSREKANRKTVAEVKSRVSPDKAAASVVRALLSEFRSTPDDLNRSNQQKKQDVTKEAPCNSCASFEAQLYKNRALIMGLQEQLEKVTMRVETECGNFDWKKSRLSESQVHTHYRVATRNEVVPHGYMTNFEQLLPDVLQMDAK